MRYRIWILILAVTMGLISACGHQSMVVLIPDPDGSVGNIRVSNTSGSIDIDTANQATIIKDRTTSPSAPVTVKQKKIEALFGEALAIEPSAPVHFILYFKTNSIDLLPESERVLQDIVTMVQQQSAQRITVVGHSDTKGDPADNFKLSMNRAVAVKNQLAGKGISEATIDVTCHGEENPLVKTADNVSNERNRRVEVVIY